jgi:hypothetical protein
MALSPTPWKVRGKAGYTGHGVNDANGRSVCAIPSNGNLPHEQRDENARMLAAGPKLADALRELSFRAERHGMNTDEAQAALDLLKA